MESTTGADITWTSDRLLPLFQAPIHLDIYDIRQASKDIQLSVTTMTGLINRPQPEVYLIGSDDDAVWLKDALASIPQNSVPVTGEDILFTLLKSYRSKIAGLIILDPGFIDSINIATTLAGQRDGIVVSPELVQTLQKEPYNLPILVDLRTFAWRNRLQAYLWAKQNLFNNASHYLLAGLDPTILSGLRSFLVASRAFVYWLDSRNFLPHPSLGWKSERGLMKDLYAALLPGAVHLGWFIDEGSGVSLTSRAAIPVLATDHFFNLEVWTSMPQLEKSASVGEVEQGVLQSPPLPEIKPKIYLSFTMSDGDNLQYDQHRMARLWHDSARGSLPLGWTISPLLSEAAPAMAAYYMRRVSSNDELLAGPSGAGYMFPSQWPAERLPAFLQRTGQLMQTMNLTILEVLNTKYSQILSSVGNQVLQWLGFGGMTLSDIKLQQRIVRELAPFGVRGLLSGSGRSRAASPVIIAGVPIYQNIGLADSIGKTLRLVRNAASSNSQRPLFLNVYVFAFRVSPSDLKQVAQQLGADYEIVSPGTLLSMTAEYSQGAVKNKA